MSDVERAEALKDMPLLSVKLITEELADLQWKCVFEWVFKHQDAIRAALQPPALDCTVCKDDPIECGALPSLRHCPSAALDAGRGYIILSWLKNIIQQRREKRSENPHIDDDNHSMLDEDHYETIRAALSAPAWRDISSAPKDGTIIDLWMNGRRYTNVYWSFSRNQKSERLEDPVWNGWVQVEERKGLSGNPYPNYIDEKGKSATNWMPLPPVPSSEGGT